MSVHTQHLFFFFFFFFFFFLPRPRRTDEWIVAAPAGGDVFVAELRFDVHATIHEHPGERDTIVVCLAGEGFTSVGDAVTHLREEQQARWPKGIPHRLWTEGTTMTTLMVEGTPVHFDA